jgi:predicted nucleotidyltransferase
MFTELLKKIGAALDSGGFPYMVIGGQAVLLYGEPRLTRDIDITLGVALERLPEMVRLTEANGFEVLVDPAEFTTKTLVLPCRDRETGIRIDFMFSWSAYGQQALGRSRRLDLAGIPVKFAALEDVIIHKIIAGRPRDLEDVRLLLIKNPTFDQSYIQNWLQEFDEALGEGFGLRFQQVWQESKREH